MIRRARMPEATPNADRRARLLAGAIAALACAAAPLTGSWLTALYVAAAGAATWRLVPAAARLARRCGATVLPGGRSIHSRQTPLLGGLAILAPFVLYLGVEGSIASLGLAAGCLVVAAAGLVDDLRGLAPRYKVAAQVGAAFLLLAAGYRAPVLEFAPVGGIAATGFEMVVVVFWIVLATNAVNLIDGLDGLATTVVAVGAVACGALGLSPGPALVLAAACAGFLRFNLPRARIFLGDTGSLLLGFAAGALVLNGAGPMNVPLALGLLALPLGDVAIAALRRWLRGKPVSSADRGHVHHVLLGLWGRPGRVLAALAVFTSVQALIAAVAPDLFGLLAIAGLWAAAGAYLVAMRRPPWRRILLHRRSFRRLHLVRRFSEESLRLAESPGDVSEVLERVADDFDLVGLRVRDLRVDRGRTHGGILVEEHVDCGAATATWSAVFTPLDPVLAEEKRTILCDLLRAADHRVGIVGLAAPTRSPAATDHGVRPLGASPAGQVHYVVEDRARLRHVSGLVRETRRRGTLEPVVVHTGRREDLGLTDAQLRELHLERPDVDLDIEPGDGIVPMSRVMERYFALLDARRPTVVVVGDSSAAAACALIAKQLRVPVAHLSGETGPADARPIARSMADLVLRPGRRGAAAGRPLRFVDGPEAAARIVPALEALLPAESPGA